MFGIFERGEKREEGMNRWKLVVKAVRNFCNWSDEHCVEWTQDGIEELERTQQYPSRVFSIAVIEKRMQDCLDAINDVVDMNYSFFWLGQTVIVTIGSSLLKAGMHLHQLMILISGIASHDHLKDCHGDQMSRSWSDGLASGDKNIPVANDGKGV